MSLLLHHELSKNGAVGVFDSGVGGISVLGMMLRMMPYERFIYYGDSLNAPYGTKTVEEIIALSVRASDILLKHDAKAIVIACNTATSAAAAVLRQTYDVPVIGMEPAVKPAVEMRRAGEIIVMATPLTLNESKFKDLSGRFRSEADIKPIACPGLVELIEAGHIDDIVIIDYIKSLFRGVDFDNVGAIVLGCTHYVFVQSAIQKIAGLDIPVLDGNQGTARQLRRVLKSQKLLADRDTCRYASDESDFSQRVEFMNSGDPSIMIPLSRDLLDKAVRIPRILQPDIYSES